MRNFVLMLFGVLVGFVLASAGIAGLGYWQGRKAPPAPHPHVAFLADAIGVRADRIDFSALNNGNWSWLCLFGPESRPTEFMREAAARRGQDVDLPPDLARSAPQGAAALGPGEGALSVVDDLGYLSLVRFGGIAPVAALKAPLCTDRRSPVVALPPQAG